MRFTKNQWFYLLVAFVFYGCSTNTLDSSASNGEISEGKIIYKITYPDIDPESSLIMMLPETLTATFKNDKLKTNFKTIASVVEMDVISNGSEKTLVTTFKVFNNEVALKTTASDSFRLGEGLGSFSYSKTTDTSEMAGKEVHKINLIYDKETSKEIFASDKFNIKSPNWATVYSSIDHMLMEYDMEQYDILMHLKAIEVKAMAIDNKEFEVSLDCEFLDISSFNQHVRNNLDILLDDLD
jgi:hypothetical protein